MATIKQVENNKYDIIITFKNKVDTVKFTEQTIDQINTIMKFDEGHIFKGPNENILLSKNGKEIITFNSNVLIFAGPVKTYNKELKDILNENDYHEYLKAQFEII